jgi:siroheme synthase-like protein
MKDNKIDNSMGNQLFPVFLKLNQLRILLVGAGNIGLEKLEAILGNSPEVQVDIVSESFLPQVLDLANQYSGLKIYQKKFELSDLKAHDLVIIATGDNELNAEIRLLARKKHLLINVADKPDLCDFYLGSIVKKGDLKIGISTNGKSPTFAKRLKEILQSNLPDELTISLQQMSQLRNTLNGDFAYKVRELNRITAFLINTPEKSSKSFKNIFKWLFGFFVVFIMIGISFTNNKLRFELSMNQILYLILI